VALATVVHAYFATSLMYARLGDAFAAKLNATGGALVYSTYLGGGSDDFAQGIAVDSQGSAYVVGRTNSGDFPTKNAFQPTDHGSDDVFVDKLTPGGDALAYGTFLGGGGDDIGYGIAADNSGKAVVTGQAVSNFPITANAPQFTYGGGGIDAFVAEVDTTLSGTASLVYSTFLGGNGEEYGYGAALDCAGNAYVTGRTSATTFITTTGGVQPGAGGGGNDAFVAKIGATRVITYAYDGVQRLTDAVECPGSTYHDGYDPASNRTSETVDGVTTRQVSYDAANQVITATTPQGTASDSYDAAGNLLSDGTSAYSYDALDRLTALAGAGAAESYGYNGDGTLVTQTVNGIPTAYTQDLAGDQSQVLQTATGAGTPTVTDYLYGLDRLASVPSGGSARTWYMPDLQGSVRYTTDDGANASPAVNYDPYGTPEGGAVPPTFGYDGELQDTATGLQNLRARTYNPATGQFLTRDPLEQQTGQAYLYASGDPINGSDPSGACYLVNSSHQRVGGALPDVEPDDQNCRLTTQANIIAGILSPRMPAVFYPSQADANCLYAQILRYVPNGGSLLRKGFFVSPAKHVPTVLPSFILGVGATVQRLTTGVVEIGEHAGEAIATGTEQVGGGAVLGLGGEVLLAAGLATAAYIVTDPAKPVGEDTAESRGVRFLYHYTFARNIPSIITQGIRPSLAANGDAQHGDGQYLTDLTPAESSTVTRYQHSYALFRRQFKWGGGRYASQVGWVRIDIDNPTRLFVVDVGPLFGNRFPGRRIYLRPSDKSLPVYNRIGGTGTVTFAPTARGFR